MNRPIKLSFIVPCYNVEKYVVRCIKSLLDNIALLKSTHDVEIITIDDGSTDGTAKTITSLNSPFVRYIYQTNQGLSGARNTGIANASGEYVWFVDADDYIIPGALSQIFENLEDNSLDILLFELLAISADKKSQGGVCIQPVPKDIVISGEEAIFKGYFPASACSAILRLSFIKANSLMFYPRLYHQDVQFMYRAMASAGKVKFTTMRPYVYEHRADSIFCDIKPEVKLKRFLDDSIVAKSFVEFASTLDNIRLSRHIISNVKSMTIGGLLRVLKEDKEIRGKVIEKYRENKLLPIHGPYRDLRQAVAAQIINFRAIINR